MAYASIPRVEAMERDSAGPLEISVFPFTDDDVALGEAPWCCAPFLHLKMRMG